LGFSKTPLSVVSGPVVSCGPAICWTSNLIASAILGGGTGALMQLGPSGTMVTLSVIQAFPFCVNRDTLGKAMTRIEKIYSIGLFISILSFNCVVLSTTARADVALPEEIACFDKISGQACQTEGGRAGKSTGYVGVCKDSSCSYSTGTRYDSGTGVATETARCILCKQSSDADASSNSRSDRSIQQDSKGKSGCAVTGRIESSRAGSGFILIAVGIVGERLRRRRGCRR
jgi:hypothetical protein